MRIVAINEAEAIIEPYFDGGSSEHPTDKYSLLTEYALETAPSSQATIFQQWHAVIVQVDKAVPGEAAAAMQRACDVRIDAYDIFRVFIGMPRWMRMTVRATIDGAEQVLIDSAAGVDTNDEYDGPMSGLHLTSLRLEFSVTEPRPAYANMFWLGVSNRADQARMEARLRQSPYTPDWPGALAPQPAGAVPEIGIFFGADELPALRQKLTAGYLAPVFEQLRQQARKDMQLNPEAEIGRYAPWPLRIFARNRDMTKTLTAGVMERLAFVGLIDGDREMSVMAARMALSAAHCEYWCESPMGVFPGASWHHRSFTEEIYCRACALVLDWAGFCFTPHGKQAVRDAIIMKGLTRIESDFKRMEYIRHMNQGIVFSSGRIIGTLALLPAHPRYRHTVEEAERDLHEMIDDYVHADGGTLEGMAYWNYTFGTSMPLVYALARFHGQTLKEYATPSLVKTGDYALGMLSITGNGTTYLPVNDAHPDSEYSPELIAACGQISSRPEWPNLYAHLMQAALPQPDLYHLILAPADVVAPRPVVEPKFAAFPDVGQVSTIRHDPALGYTHFHLCSGPAFWGHYDEDKGSFILEAGGEVLAMDRGVSGYDHPEANLMGFASRHNVLYPERPDGAEVHQPTDVPGARLTSAFDRDGVVMLASDNAAAWAPGLFARNMRRVYSPRPDLFIIDDEAQLPEALALSFRLNTLSPVQLADGECRVAGTRASLRIVPLNWTPAQAECAPLGLDGHLRPVNLLRLVTPVAQSHRLLTAIEIIPAGAQPRWQRSASAQVIEWSGGDEVLRLVPHDAQLTVTFIRAGKTLSAAICLDGTWQIQE
jgi:hypothetical protein